MHCFLSLRFMESWVGTKEVRTESLLRNVWRWHIWISHLGKSVSVPIGWVKHFFIVRVLEQAYFCIPSLFLWHSFTGPLSLCGKKDQGRTTSTFAIWDFLHVILLLPRRTRLIPCIFLGTFISSIYGFPTNRWIVLEGPISGHTIAQSTLNRPSYPLLDLTPFETFLPKNCATDVQTAVGNRIAFWLFIIMWSSVSYPPGPWKKKDLWDWFWRHCG